MDCWITNVNGVIVKENVVVFIFIYFIVVLDFFLLYILYILIKVPNI